MRNQIRRFRQERNLTLKQIADELNTTPQTISRLENEVMTLSTDWLKKFADVFKVHPAELLGGPASREVRELGTLDTSGVLGSVREQALPITVPAPNPIAVRLSDDIGPFSRGDVLIANQLHGPDMIYATGHDALAGLPDGRVLLRRIVRGDRPETYTLVPLQSGKEVQHNLHLNWIGRIVMRLTYYNSN